MLLHHNTHVHTVVGGTGTSGSFVAEDHGPIGTFSYEIILTATDSSGLRASTSVNIPVGERRMPPSAPAGLAATAAATPVDLAWPPRPTTPPSRIPGRALPGAGCTDFAERKLASGEKYTTTASRVDDVPLSGAGRRRFGQPWRVLPNVVEATTDIAPPTPPGLVGGWAFSEGFGSTTADASGNGNIGTIANATWRTQGRFGNALMFNGAGTGCGWTNSTSLNVTSAMTMSAWIQPTVTQSGWRTDHAEVNRGVSS